MNLNKTYFLNDVHAQKMELYLSYAGYGIGEHAGLDSATYKLASLDVKDANIKTFLRDKQHRGQTAMRSIGKLVKLAVDLYTNRLTAGVTIHDVFRALVATTKWLFRIKH
ncbi:hypothetical protein IC619_011410 [Hazenella sp. IB182353]|uniref:hypothetical protein n=1 Tax=Polycladospora coralii TaxID=2771432 RepID=UPI001747BF73|nr:hypothetical protein [Polycladospora coralii]MBS7531102.1 hypothetical protein [Polycladospora coralii]